MSSSDSNISVNTLNALKCEPRALDEALGSQYALKVALQTMKERCHQFQQRLALVEEENLRLRIREGNAVCVVKSEDVQSGTKDDNTSDLSRKVEKLQEQVSLLIREKSQLLQHNSMVTTENHQLWEKLSRITQVNQSLGSHLTKISDTLIRHDSTGIQRTISGNATEKLETHKQTQDLIPNTMLDYEENSLDEISLKVINSLKQEKADLEDECLQMEDIQNIASCPIQNLGFNFLEKEGESTMQDVNDHWCQLNNVKELLVWQRTCLKNLLVNQEKNVLLKDCAVCFECMARARNQIVCCDASAPAEQLTSTQPSSHNLEPQDLPIELDQNRITGDDRICPLCGKFYPRLIPFDEFQNHVLLHFGDEDMIENFEIVP